MFGRKDVTATANDAIDTVSPYVDQLAHDEKLRKRLAAAIAAGAAARRRAQKQTGLLGLATRLATDPVLREQLGEAATQLQKANSRVKKHKSHKLRNTVLLLAGVGAVVAALPSLRETVLSHFGGDDPFAGDVPHTNDSAVHTTPTVTSPTDTTPADV